jgi:hypothetical protein
VTKRLKITDEPLDIAVWPAKIDEELINIREDDSAMSEELIG